MTPKILIFLIAAFAAVQIFAHEAEIDSPLDPVIALAGKILEYVHKLIDLALVGSEQILTNLLSKIDSLRAGAMKLAENEIEMEYNLLDKFIEAVKSRSNDTSLDILECLESVEKEGADVQRNAVNSSMTCIDTSIEATGKHVLLMLNDLKAINTEFEQHEEKLDSCKGKLLPFNCINGVVADLGKLALSLPEKIKEEVDKALADSAVLTYEIFQCVRSAAHIMQDQNTKIFNDFSQCVHDKEHSDQTTLGS